MLNGVTPDLPANSGLSPMYIWMNLNISDASFFTSLFSVRMMGFLIGSWTNVYNIVQQFTDINAALTNFTEVKKFNWMACIKVSQLNDSMPLGILMTKFTSMWHKNLTSSSSLLKKLKEQQKSPWKFVFVAGRMLTKPPGMQASILGTCHKPG